ncbi:MAG: FAD-dependent oxidoreductase [Armatimonadota bacterium]
MTAHHISVIGGGLAGCAAALAAEARGVRVTLYEQRPARTTAMHQTALPGELTGTADLGVEDPDRATGLLKAEIRVICPEVTACADAARIAGQTMAVDRAAFAAAIAERIEAAEGITLVREQARTLPDGPVVIASGPATWSPLARAIHAACGAGFHFAFIGRPPLIAAESIDRSDARQEPPYPGAEPALFVPLTEREAEQFAAALVAGERREPPDFGHEAVLADESRTAERMAADPEVGVGRLLRGPRGPETDVAPPALCLTPDDADPRAYHVEGLLTALTAESQLDTLRAVDALAGVQILRPGLVHRTPLLAGPEATLPNLQLRRTGRALVAGTLSGVYGYAEAIATGAVAGIGAARMARGPEPLPPPRECLAGALCWAVAETEPHPDGRMLRANFGMIPEHRQDQGLDKARRRERQEKRALDATERYAGAD